MHCALRLFESSVMILVSVDDLGGWEGALI